MRALGNSLICAVLVLFLAPSAATSLDRNPRERGREAAYNAGFNDGYRDGLRRGEFDQRAHLRYNDRNRWVDRGSGFYGKESYFGKYYKKGFKDGYRQGYRDGYRHIGYRRGFRRSY